MRILVTGGTGFVGSHITVALMRAGHDVRLLVRRPEQVPVTFARYDVVPHDLRTGDVTDPSSVVGAVAGCDTVVHAAAVYSLDPRRAAEALATNERSTRLVLEAGVAVGCDPVVHISSTVALLGRGTVGPDLPVGDLDQPYARSKAASERVARELQDRGAPVVTVYPGGVYGPGDPYHGEQDQMLSCIARGLVPIWARGGLHSVDARDVGAVVAAVVDAGPGRGPRRYVIPGHHVGGAELFGAVGQAIGRRRRFVMLPRRLTRVAAGQTSLLNRMLPPRFRYPTDVEGAEYLLRDAHFDTSATTAELGVKARPFEESVRDEIAWLVDSGRLPEKYRLR